MDQFLNMEWVPTVEVFSSVPPPANPSETVAASAEVEEDDPAVINELTNTPNNNQSTFASYPDSNQHTSICFFIQITINRHLVFTPITINRHLLFPCTTLP
jgi:hypothetical protein